MRAGAGAACSAVNIDIESEMGRIGPTRQRSQHQEDIKQLARDPWAYIATTPIPAAGPSVDERG
jgi:hypothetical protein